MNGLLEHITGKIVTIEIHPAHLTIMGLIALVALGSLVAPLLGPFTQAAFNLARYVGHRLWNIILEKLITSITLTVLALMGGIAWLADYIEVLAKLLRY